MKLMLYCNRHSIALLSVPRTASAALLPLVSACTGDGLNVQGTGVEDHMQAAAQDVQLSAVCANSLILRIASAVEGPGKYLGFLWEA